MLHSMTIWLIHEHQLETLHLFYGSNVNLGSALGHPGRVRRLWRQQTLVTHPLQTDVSCFSCVLTQAHAMRLCSVSLKFFNFFLSTTLSNVSTKCLNQFWWNLVTMTNDQARRCPMTFDPVKGHSRSKGSKINIFSKTHQVHQVSWYVHNTHTHDSLQCPLQKLSD